MLIIYKLKVVLIILYYILIRLQIMFHKYLKHKKVFLILVFQSVQKSINQLFKRTWDFFQIHHSSWNGLQNKESFYILPQLFSIFFCSFQSTFLNHSSSFSPYFPQALVLSNTKNIQMSNLQGHMFHNFRLKIVFTFLLKILFNRNILIFASLFSLQNPLSSYFVISNFSVMYKICFLFAFFISLITLRFIIEEYCSAYL